MGESIRFSGVLFTSIIPWIFGGSLLFGAGLALLTAFPSRSRKPARLRLQKWIFVPLLWGMSIIVVSTGLVFADFSPNWVKDVEFTAAVWLVLSFLTFRFKKSLGTLIFACLLFSGFIMTYQLQSYFTLDDTELGIFQGEQSFTISGGSFGVKILEGEAASYTLHQVSYNAPIPVPGKWFSFEVTKSDGEVYRFPDVHLFLLKDLPPFLQKFITTETYTGLFSDWENGSYTALSSLIPETQDD